MSKKLIYVVDDEENIRRLLEFWLKVKWGYEIRLFSSGRECLDALDDNPDLVILDIMLHDITGIDVLKQIRSTSPDLPVIVLSAQARMETAVEALKLGAIDYFPKTIDFPKLASAIRNGMELHDLKREVLQLRERVASNGRFEETLCLHDSSTAAGTSVNGRHEFGISSPSLFEGVEKIIPMNSLKEQALRHALKVTHGNILEAARGLKISRSTFYEMMKKYEVCPD